MKYFRPIFVLLACLLAFGAGSAAANDPQIKDFGKFKLRANVFLEMAVIYDGDEIGSAGSSGIADLEGVYTQVDYMPVMEDFPLPGWHTLQVCVSTFGATCCRGYYLLSQSKDNAAAAFLPPNDYYMELYENKHLLISDPSFMYYSVDAGNGVEASLSKAGSPAPHRLLVFAGNGWRLDKPGEFPEVYNNLLRQYDAANDNEPLRRDIIVSYYTLMAGKSPAEVRARFMDNPPSGNQRLYPLVLNDVEKAIRQFAPVQNLNLNANGN